MTRDPVRVALLVMVALMLVVGLGGLTYADHRYSMEDECEGSADNWPECQMVCEEVPIWWEFGEHIRCTWRTRP